MTTLEKTRRCMQFMDVTGVKDDNTRFDYIAACPAGLFTCYDGACVPKKSNCFNRCDKDNKCKRKRIRGRVQYQQHPIRYLATKCGQDCRNRREIDEVCPSGYNDIICAMMVPTNIPGLLPEVTCCVNPDEPTVQIVNMTTYSGLSCCPELPDEGVIGREPVPSSEPAFNIYPIPFDVYTKPATSFDLVNITMFDLEFNTQSDDQCCCSLQCSCIGDPHCNSFNKMERSSLAVGEEFTMISEGPTSNADGNLDGFLILNVTNGELGVADKLKIKLVKDNNNVYVLDSAHAHANCWKKVPLNGAKSSYPRQDKLPKALTENFEGTGSQTCPSELSSDVSFRARNEIYINGVNIRYTALKHHNEDLLRFDIFVDRYVESKKQCCGAPAKMISQLKETAQGELSFDGFCYNPNSDAINEVFLPMAPTTGRLLEEGAGNDDTSDFDSFCFTVYCKDSENPSCMAECMMLAYDFGVEALESEVKAGVGVAKTCKTIEDPSFTKQLDPCESGFTLQAAKKGTTNWNFVRAFPSDTVFCDNKLVIPLESGSRLKFNLNGKTQSLSPDKFDLRLAERTNVADNCNPCKNRATLKRFDTSFTLVRSPGGLPPVMCPDPTQCRTCENKRLL